MDAVRFFSEGLAFSSAQQFSLRHLSFSLLGTIPVLLFDLISQDN